MNAKGIQQCKSAPTVRAKAQVSIVAPSLATKVESLVLGNRLPQSYELLKLLADRCGVKAVRVNVPETYWASGDDVCFLGTDSAGFVRADKTSNHKNRQIRFKNPLGVKFPKFLSFKTENVESLFKHKAAIKEALTHPPVFVQRYVVPESYLATIKLVHWKRTKPTLTYTLSSRQTLKIHRKDSSEPGPALSHEVVGNPFIVSLRSLKNASISKEKGMPEDISPVVNTLRDEVLRPSLSEGAVIEEMVCCVMKGLDGGCYTLSLLKARITQSDPTDEQPRTKLPRNRACLRLSDIMADEHKLDELNCSELPFLSLTDLRRDNKHVYRPSRELSPNYQSLTERSVDSGLDSIADKLDLLKKEGKHLKSEFGVVRKVDFSGYPKEFLDNVMKKLYTSVMHDPRLSKFYPSDRATAQSRLESSVRQSVERGTSRYLKLRMQKIHEHMGITSKDFDQYLRYFAEAMRTENAVEADVSETIGFLNEFRGDVVMARREAEGEDGETFKSFGGV